MEDKFELKIKQLRDRALLFLICSIIVLVIILFAFPSFDFYKLFTVLMVIDLVFVLISRKKGPKSSEYKGLQTPCILLVENLEYLQKLTNKIDERLILSKKEKLETNYIRFLKKNNKAFYLESGFNLEEGLNLINEFLRLNNYNIQININDIVNIESEVDISKENLYLNNIRNFLLNNRYEMFLFYTVEGKVTQLSQIGGYNLTIVPFEVAERLCKEEDQNKR